MEELMQYYRNIIANMRFGFHRYMYDKINWNNRLIGIMGPRGIGKTTLIIQHIKEQLDLNDALYVVADDIYFSNHRLLDLAKELSQQGVHHFFIDEIHKYPEWSRELKLIYDYYPSLNVVFSGSSVLDIMKGEADLSRRALVYSMQGLSFREFLELFHEIKVPIYDIGQIVGGNVEIDVPNIHPLKLFKEYLRSGYYPFSTENDFLPRIRQIINVTMENDIPMYAGMNASMGNKLKHLLSIVAESVPFKPNYSKIAEMLDLSRNSIKEYIYYVERAGMVMQLYGDTGGLRQLGKVEKLYLDNTNLIYSLSGENGEVGNIRETFFLNQMRVRNDVKESHLSDFQIGDMTFEVGGEKKGRKQIKEAEKGYVVRDDIEYAAGNAIPLWHFGLNY